MILHTGTPGGADQGLQFANMFPRHKKNVEQLVKLSTQGQEGGTPTPNVEEERQRAFTFIIVSRPGYVVT